MRLLSIRGQNLASLSQGFTVNFEEEPLKGAGLFAITGETGAGKSTLLDAMCLALFNQCPRLSAEGKGYALTDVGGETLGEKDSRTVLSRGASEGYAEVDFTGQDGDAYRARWAVRRARGKASGRLQKVERSLMRLSDEVVLENSITGVESVIPQILGLSYEQFRRTVLLAQGDFDAFLRAGDKERAALLEKITGTSVYRQISKQVYQRTSEAQAVVDTLRDKGEAIGLLDEAQRAELEGLRDALGVSRAREAAQLKGLQEDLQKNKALDAAQQQLVSTREAMGQAQQRLGNAADKQQLLATLKRIKIVEPLAQQVEMRKGEEVSELDAFTQLQTQMQALDAQRQGEQEALRKAQQLSAQLQDQVRQFEPQWRLAEQKDLQLSHSQAECDKLSRRVGDLAVRTADTREKLVNAQSRQQDLAAVKAKVKAQLERLQPLRPIVDAEQSLRGDLHRAGDTAEQLQKQEAQLSQLKQAEHEKAQLQQELESKLQDMGAQVAQAEAQLAAEQQAIAAIDGARLHEQQKLMLRLEQQVSSLQMSAQKARHKEQDKEQISTEVTVLEAALTGLAHEVDGARQVADQASQNERMTADLGALADMAASEQVKHLRSGLLEDEPCPVCGSREHPASKGAAEQQLFAGVQKARTEAQVRAKQARAALERVLAKQSGDAARLQALLAQKTRAEKEIIALREEAGRAWHGLPLMLEQSDLPAPPPLEDVLLGRGSLTGLQEASKSRLGELEGQLAALEAQRVALAEAQQARDELHQSLTRASAQASAVKADLVGLLVQRQEREAQLKEGKSELARLLAAIDDVAGAPQSARLTGLQGEALMRGLSALLRFVGETRKSWNECKDELERCEVQLGAMAAEIASLQARLEENEGQLLPQQQQLDALQQQLGELQRTRAELLGGEGTQAHRARHQDALKQAQAEAAQLLGQLGQVNEQLAAAHGQSTQKKARLEELRTAITQGEAGFATALQREGLSPEQFTLLRPTADEQLAQLQEELERLTQEAALACEAYKLRQSDVERLAAQHDESMDLSELTKQIDEVRAKHEQNAVELGALNERLSCDNVARAEAEQLAVQLSAAQSQTALWGAVNQAIGSADGDRFQKAAQGVTLDLLVALANKQLHNLKPRYRMRRDPAGLGIYVEDLELGLGGRSTRSLSGGERFLVSLSLALALSNLEGRQSFADTLFIDEGFGTLDSETLDVAIDALEMLQGQGRKVGVISHVEAMKERIPVQIQVLKAGAGRSRIAVHAPSGW
ncbi:AAA family ATPase [Polycladidibacter hongkongensis]|uniref:AAA family ATPase n=1 Tax=Polycladidibacter hongkongensis TaxID=1647556 RepID=UPI00082CB000|nr:AAA family ATPase [Pseudovibrio hongkongensis]